MEWMEIAAHTTTLGADIVSEQMMLEGAEGTAIEDRADVPDPGKPSGYWELIDQSLIDQMPEDVLVKAWFQADEKCGDRIAGLKARLSRLKAVERGVPLGSLRLDMKAVAEADWAQVWKKFYKPFRAGKTLVVKPTWEMYAEKPGDKVIKIDPGMAFGSGTHETTGMCLELLERYLRPGVKVIDVGTGSGILAIGAALLGGRDVKAIDIDPVAVRVAKENVALNGLEGRIRVEQGDLIEHVEEACGLCVANIIADVICQLCLPLRGHITENGLFICSGIIREREESVRRALEGAGYAILDTLRRGEWVAMVARRG